MYFTVYDPHGEMFEVPAAKVRELTLVRGWTLWHPAAQQPVFRDEQKQEDPEGTLE